MHTIWWGIIYCIIGCCLCAHTHTHTHTHTWFVLKRTQNAVETPMAGILSDQLMLPKCHWMQAHSRNVNDRSPLGPTHATKMLLNACKTEQTHQWRESPGTKSCYPNVAECMQSAIETSIMGVQRDRPGNLSRELNREVEARPHQEMEPWRRQAQKWASRGNLNREVNREV